MRVKGVKNEIFIEIYSGRIPFSSKAKRSEAERIKRNEARISFNISFHVPCMGGVRGREAHPNKPLIKKRIVLNNLIY
jgi:hypothetical protein